MENMRIPELKTLARECRLRSYSRLRKAELIAFLQDNEHQAQRPPPSPPQRHAAPTPQMSTWEPNRPPQMSTWEPEREQEQPEGPLVPRSAELEASLMKRQLKHRQNKDFKLVKKFVSLNAEISNLKCQIRTLEDKITKASKSTNAGFKRKKIRSMKREADKINEKLRESEKALRAVEPRVPKDPITRSPIKLHPPNRNECIEAEIAVLNKSLRRVRQNKIRSALIAKRDKLKKELDFESNWGFVQLQRASLRNIGGQSMQW